MKLRMGVKIKHLLEIGASSVVMPHHPARGGVDRVSIAVYWASWQTRGKIVDIGPDRRQIACRHASRVVEPKLYLDFDIPLVDVI